MAYEETVETIRTLTEQLKKGETTFVEVWTQTTKIVQPVTGEPHYEANSATLEALKCLAGELARAFFREEQKIIEHVSSTIAFGVAVGIFGPDFFRSFTKIK